MLWGTNKFSDMCLLEMIADLDISSAHFPVLFLFVELRRAIYNKKFNLIDLGNSEFYIKIEYRSQDEVNSKACHNQRGEHPSL